jgi:hypothetical protein
MIHHDQMGKTRAGEGEDSGIRPTEIAGRTKTYPTAQGENGATC